MNLFKQLSETELHEFLKYPVYISLLAANMDSFVSEEEKEQAVSFDDLETYNCLPLLTGFYEEAQKNYQPNLEMLDNQLPKGKLERDVAIKVELRKIKELLRKLDPANAAMMHHSMKAFKDHVSAKHDHVLDDFLFPIPIKGLTGDPT
ncbi:hypothetical protein [Mucilaginibacter sp. UYCu711]|uniref:hypothetical protein n=1 Tax=Mucilaginibacter sp. UYCu711 TaxID=3156339 RepID=UPI003D1F631D